MENGERIVEVDCITHVYPDMTKVQICGLDFIVNRGERVSILGANGCGKTTLLKHLMGVLVPKDGSVKVFGWIPGRSTKRLERRLVLSCRMWMNRSLAPRSSMISFLLH